MNIKTWRCSSCNYAQDFDPENKAQWNEIFPNKPAGLCPSCDKDKLKQETDSKKQIVVSIITDLEIDKLKTKDLEEKQTTKEKLKTQAKKDRTKFKSSKYKA